MPVQRPKTSNLKASQPPSGTIDQPVIDIAILTIRDDEFRAVLDAFPSGHGIHKGRHREYAMRTADAGGGDQYRVAILRQIEQGNGEAQEAARDLIDDLQPSLLLVVGIAGGLPSDDISLGDVVLSTRVHDFSLEARKFEETTTYNVGGGPIAKSIAAGVANLGAREPELGDWWSELPLKPSVSLSASKLYGPPKWQREVRSKLQAHYGKGVEERPPTFAAGLPATGSSKILSCSFPGLQALAAFWQSKWSRPVFIAQPARGCRCCRFVV